MVVKMKYKLDKNNTITFRGRTLFAVVALIAFNDVSVGDVGGYIEKETNLSQSGNAWVYSGARVMGDTIIRGGVFRGGEFYDGVFYDGVFYDGVFRGGVFRGGEFYDGEFYDGVFYGGVFYGGVFRGGWFYDGEFRGGEFRGGVFYDGEFYGGVFRGGWFYDGEFRGGEFRGGVFRGGVFRSGWLILQIQGSRHFVNIPDGENIKIGCQEHPPKKWLSEFESIGKNNEYSENEIIEYKDYIELAAAMIERNKK
jgi:hypothetical protein